MRVGSLCAGAVLASTLTAGVASAQGYPPPPPPPHGYVVVEDGARFRGGVSLMGGLLAVPGVVNIGSIGIQGALGAQINNNWGVYAIPSFDIIVGKVGGVGIGGGVMADYTFDGLPISVGAGVEAGLFAAIGASNCNSQGTSCGTASAAGGALYGGRLRFAYHPVIVRGENRIRRRALSIGLDLRLLTGAFGASSESNGTTVTAAASVNSFAVAPVVWIGYTAF